MSDNTIDRNFKGADGTTEYFISSPTAEDIRGADWQYSKTYTKCLVEGITTAAEMQDILMRRGIIGPEFEQRAQELIADLRSKIDQLDSAETMEDKRNLAVEVSIAREELFQWNQRLNGPLSNTCEQMADDSRLEHLTSSITKDANGKRVWENYDAFLKSKNKDLAMRARFEVMLFLQGLDSNFMEKSPEAMAMKEVEEDLMTRARAALEAAKAAAEEELVDELKEEQLVTEEHNTSVESEVVKPKTNRKKTK
ncbi:MAG TPA: hypothetical protein VI911_07990 [Patescibacteria group bacterium]|nr:hypothetical protein [Patescibacteria group bacterium]